MKRKSLELQSSERFWWLRRITFHFIILAVILGIDATKHRLQPTLVNDSTTSVSYGLKADRNKQNIQHFSGNKWEDWTIKGVNLGMAKPGAFPGNAAITKAEYKQWLKQITLPLTGEQLPFEKFTVGALTAGNSNPSSKDYNSLADFSTPSKETIEIRIPWMVLNAKAPNIKEFIGDIYTTEETDGLNSKHTIDNIGFTVQIGDKNITTASDGEYATYDYKKWRDVVQYTSRLKKSYYYMQKTYQNTK
ncbi:hypothetical protein [Bacillus gaemokensis]|uniref:Uncharacterized protein n=1 Tax=Bacillus gaemokensis TaxID=574375 RepID=A0A073KAU3_9BACI|nr:hypothetical protein [Bacillus gaemokensis]KEK24394.1 hypothetical protein BAGA_27015 [Bacillus gaemokensis]KYG38370.1 hypothetical protein AZF08_18745 [Bacillus gaemokensis]